MGLQAAQIWCPGAITSGFSTSVGFLLRSVKSGPLEENLLTMGARPSNEATLPSPMPACALNLIATPLSSLWVCCS